MDSRTLNTLYSGDKLYKYNNGSRNSNKRDVQFTAIYHFIPATSHTVNIT